MIEMMATAMSVFVARSSRRPRRLAGRGQDERELADLGGGHGDRDGDPEGVFEQEDDRQGGQRLCRRRTTADVRPRRGRETRSGSWAEEHADRDEEEDGEGVPHRQHLGRRPEAEFRASDDHPGEEGPEGHRDAEELGRPHGDAQGQDQHRQREELARPRRGHAVEEPGDEPLADQEGQARPSRRP